MHHTITNLSEPTSTQLYSDAVTANGLVFTTGQMPLDENWNLVAESFDEQVAFVFERLETLLRAAGSAPEGIVKLTVYLADIDHVAALAPHRERLLGTHRPASVIVQSGGFGTPGMLIEAEAIASVLDSGAAR